MILYLMVNDFKIALSSLLYPQYPFFYKQNSILGKANGESLERHCQSICDVAVFSYASA